MVPRRLCNTPELLDKVDGELLPNWNSPHFAQNHPNPAGGSAEGGFLGCPSQPLTSWNPAPTSNGYIFNENRKISHHQHDAPCPSIDSFAQSSIGLPLRKVPEIHEYAPSSSQHDCRTLHGSDGSFVQFMASDGIGLRKRKWPPMHSVYEQGSTSSRYANRGSSICPSPEHLTARQNVYQNMQREHTSVCSINQNHQSSHLLDAEGFTRNVRTRYEFDLESSYGDHNLSNTHFLDSNHSSSSVDQQLHGPHFNDASHFNSMKTYFHAGSSSRAYDSHGASHCGHFGNDFLPHVTVGFSEHCARGVHDNYYYQPSHIQNYEPSRSLHFRPEMPTNEAWQQQRQMPTGIWHNNSIGRFNISSQRSSSVDPDPLPHGRFQSEGFLIIDRPLLFGSQSVYDPHRDMRMDIDDMSYEDLLALGERIGSVHTGLSEGEVSSCLKEALCCRVNRCEEKQACAICLEEYRVEDVVGTVKACGHYYHASCITKWLSMKNSCPICKVAALPDAMS